MWMKRSLVVGHAALISDAQQSMKRPQAEAAAKGGGTLTHAADFCFLLQFHFITVSDTSTKVQSSNSNQGANLAAKDLAGPP